MPEQESGKAIPSETSAIFDTLLIFLPKQREGSTDYEQVPLTGLDYPLNRRGALDVVGLKLSETFFGRYGDINTDISFSVDTIKKLCTDTACLHIAKISIHDADTILVKTFFQGSTGGQATYNVLTASFLQPQMQDPLLDGVVFTVNGKFVPELSHLDLSGIQVAKLLHPRIQRMTARR